MQLRGPLVGPDRWWYHTLLKGTVRETLASYGSVPESGPPLSFDQQVLEPNHSLIEAVEASRQKRSDLPAGKEAFFWRVSYRKMNEGRNSALERLKRHGGPTTRLGLQYDVMSDSEADATPSALFFRKPHN